VTGTLRIALVLGSAALLVLATTFAPLGLRRFNGFRVQRVEVVGARYLTAEAAAAASGITTASNIFDDATPWIDALLSHPLVVEASVERRLPGTIRLHVSESKPVAFARTPELRAIDELGRVLPADPAADGMDLPVLALQTRVSAAGRAADSATIRIAAFLGLVGRTEPGLLGWISEVGVHHDAIRLVLRNATDAEVLVPAGPTPLRLRELHLTLAELATPRYAAAATDRSGAQAPGANASGAAADSTTRVLEPELARVRRIDGRFNDQIVVALHAGKK
jgi:hypothetical protein